MHFIGGSDVLHKLGLIVPYTVAQLPQFFFDFFDRRKTTT